MPFPWKKKKAIRISQIVADLQSPKRGGSLVVETGFPTSLIDLFVKNRSRFKKSKTKKRVQHEISDPLPPTLPPEPLNSCDGVGVRAEPVYTQAPSLRRSVVVGEGLHRDGAVAGLGEDRNRVDERVRGSDGNMVLIMAAILEMLVAVVLILCVKKLTVGITMSAFVLLLLQYVGKRVVCCLKPCSNANHLFKSLAPRVSNSIWSLKFARNKRKNSDGSEPAITVHEDPPVSESVKAAELSSASSRCYSFSSSCIEEDKIVGTNGERDVCSEGTNFPGPGLNSISQKWGCPEMEEDSKGKVAERCESCEGKVKGCRSGGGKFKSIVMKKLLSKKLRGSKKEKIDKKGEKSKEREAETCSKFSSTVEEDKAASFEIEEERENVGKEKHDKVFRSPSLVSRKLERIKDDELDYGMSRSNESSQLEREVGVSDKEKRIDRVGNSGYIILFVIALAGLLVGRIPAMLLTLAWPFMLKIANTRGRSLNPPPLNSSVPIS